MEATATATAPPTAPATSEPQGFQITSTTDRGGLVVSVDGELDIFRVGDLEHALAVAGSKSTAKVLLDLRRVTFIDGRAIEALATATRRFAESKTDFRIADVSGQVARVLRITGVDLALPLCDDPRDNSLPRPFGVDFLAAG